MVLVNRKIKTMFKPVFQVCKIMNKTYLLEGVEQVFVEWMKEAEALEKVNTSNKHINLRSQPLHFDISSKEKVNYPWNMTQHFVPAYSWIYEQKKK